MGSEDVNLVSTLDYEGDVLFRVVRCYQRVREVLIGVHVFFSRFLAFWRNGQPQLEGGPVNHIQQKNLANHSAVRIP